jgi:glycosyltransferase involved in cell wall biosynthesis
MLKKFFSYYHNTIFPWQFSKKKIFSKKLCIGFCSYFPPFPHGVASATYYLLKELSKHTEIELYLIPLHNKINKKLFSFMPLRFAQVDSSYLDCIIFFGLGDSYQETAEKARCKKIAWQTMHEDPRTELKPISGPTEQEILNQIKNSDLILTMTRWATSCYQQQVPTVAYMPHSVDPNLFQPIKKKTPFTCLFVSRLHYAKGIFTFLDAIPLVLNYDSSIQFTIISPEDTQTPYYTEIHSLLQTMIKKYPSNIHLEKSWISFSEIPSIYAQADILVFPSNNEGFGIPLIEAMSCEVPCIVLNKKPMSEIIKNTQTGYCLQPCKKKDQYQGLEFPDPKEIAEKILFLKKHEFQKKQLGQQGRERVINEYNIYKQTDALINHCHRICSKI